MKTVLKTSLASLMLGIATTSHAVPKLQIDIGGGSYVGGSEESVVTTDSSFSLYALLKDAALADTSYYLSVALITQDGMGIGETAPDVGSIMVNGSSYDVTGDMIYGTPPHDGVSEGTSDDKHDLPSHGIFDTYFLELAFAFDTGSTTCEYNVEDSAGGLVSGCTDETMLYEGFSFDISGLNDDYALHFDLYDIESKKGDLDEGIFAPFSHDARTSTSVPEPSILALLGLGMFGLGVARKIKK